MAERAFSSQVAPRMYPYPYYSGPFPHGMPTFYPPHMGTAFASGLGTTPSGFAGGSGTTPSQFSPSQFSLFSFSPSWFSPYVGIGVGGGSTIFPAHFSSTVLTTMTS